jgi:hypothetical protein
MALILSGKTKCPLCGKAILATDKIVGFPAAFPNENDPLHIFHDAAVHEQCLNSHPLKLAAERRMAEYRQKTGPGNRRCYVCGKEILKPDEYTGLGHLTDDPTLTASKYNYAHFHRSCFKVWPERTHVLSLLEDMVKTGAWRGPGLSLMIKDLKGK